MKTTEKERAELRADVKMVREIDDLGLIDVGPRELLALLDDADRCAELEKKLKAQEQHWAHQYENCAVKLKAAENRAVILAEQMTTLSEQLDADLDGDDGELEAPEAKGQTDEPPPSKPDYYGDVVRLLAAALPTCPRCGKTFWGGGRGLHCGCAGPFTLIGALHHAAKYTRCKACSGMPTCSTDGIYYCYECTGDSASYYAAEWIELNKEKKDERGNERQNSKMGSMEAPTSDCEVGDGAADGPCNARPMEQTVRTRADGDGCGEEVGSVEALGRVKRTFAEKYFHGPLPHTAFDQAVVELLQEHERRLDALSSLGMPRSTMDLLKLTQGARWKRLTSRQS